MTRSRSHGREGAEPTFEPDSGAKSQLYEPHSVLGLNQSNVHRLNYLAASAHAGNRAGAEGRTRRPQAAGTTTTLRRGDSPAREGEGNEGEPKRGRVGAGGVVAPAAPATEPPASRVGKGPSLLNAS